MFTKLLNNWKTIAEIASSLTRQEILEDWLWLLNNVAETLRSFDKEDDITEFVKCKVESLIATSQNVDIDGT